MKRFMVMMLVAGSVQAAEVPAVLQWSQRVELSTPVSGVVRSVNANVGERVKKGQGLLRLDDRIYAARAEEAAAEAAKRREEAAEAARDLKRVQELYDRTVIATSELEQAQLRQARASASLREARARHAREIRNRADTVVRAPFDALVVARMAEPGQVVAAGLQPPPLLVVARSGEMLARSRMYEEQLVRLKTGQEIKVGVGSRVFQGRILTIGLEPAAQDKSGAALYDVDVLFSTGDGVLHAGGAATLALP